MGGPVQLLLPQDCNSFESEDSKLAVRLPSIDKEPLGKDAKDLMTDSDSDQQQQQSLLNSTSSSSSSLDHTPTKVNLLPSQQVQNVKKSFKASSSRGPLGRRRNQGIKAAKQRFQLIKAARQQEAKAAPEFLKAGNQMSSKSSAPLNNRSVALNSSSSASSTSQTSAREKAASQPVVLLPSQSLYAQKPTPFSTTANDFANQSCQHARPNSAFQHPLPQLPNGSSSPSSAMMSRNYRVQSDWPTREYLFIKVYGLPDSTTTRDLWAAFKGEGHIAHIRLYENARGYRDGNASIKFRYALRSGPCSSHRNN